MRRLLFTLFIFLVSIPAVAQNDVDYLFVVDVDGTEVEDTAWDLLLDCYEVVGMAISEDAIGLYSLIARETTLCTAPVNPYLLLTGVGDVAEVAIEGEEGCYSVVAMSSELNGEYSLLMREHPCFSPFLRIWHQDAEASPYGGPVAASSRLRCPC